MDPPSDPGLAEFCRRQETLPPQHARHTVVALGGIVLALVAWSVDATSRIAEPPQRLPAAVRLQVDLNRASVEELMLLPGIGPALAKRIVEHRQLMGPFDSIEALDEVPGIGAAKIRSAAPYLRI